MLLASPMRKRLKVEDSRGALLSTTKPSQLVPSTSSTSPHVQPNPATISSQKTKRARLSAPEDEECCLRGVVMVDTVKEAIWNALNHYAYEDAVFAAERLYSELNTAESIFLLATCLYRAGDTHRAFEILSRCPADQTSSEIRYLYGKLCTELEHYQKAENILTNCFAFGKQCPPDDVEKLYKPDTCSYALQVLGQVYSKSQRKEMAATTLKRAVSLNPFQWSSFEAICHMKEDISAKETFFRTVSSKVVPSDGHSGDENEEGVPDEDVDMPADDDAIPSPSLPSLPPSPVKVAAPTLPARRTEKATFGPVRAAQIRGSVVQEDSLCITPFPSTRSSVVPTPLLTANSPSRRTPNTSHSQLNLSMESPNLCQSSQAKKVKSKAPGVFRMTGNSSTLESPSLFNRAQRLSSEASNTSSLGSSPAQPPLRRSTRLQASKTATGSAVKENKTLQKRGDLEDSRLKPSKKMNRLDKTSSNLIKSESHTENTPDPAVERSENSIIGVAVKKSNTPEESNKTSGGTLRQKRKKETSDCSVSVTLLEPSSTEIALTEQERLSALVMRSYCRFGDVVQLLYAYDIPAALEKLTLISPEQKEAPFYWYLKGRLHFEMLEYDYSVHAFEEMRRKDPYYSKGIDYYSVALWHLQKEKDLAILAKYMVQHHRNAPETYVVYGNVFSVQREHEYAIKMFRRALQLSPNYAYALTLLGHEYIATEDKDKAAQCFRLAINADPSHYNGWYGLGLIEHKRENYPAALANFKQALAVYPSNPVILVQLGVAQHALKQTAEALRTLSSAVTAFPRNPLCRFQKASLLYSMGHLEKATEELNVLKDLAPKESLVYFLLGKVSKRSGNTHTALMYFSKAMDLDPKGTNNQIKEAFNKLYGGVEDDIVPRRGPGTSTATASTSTA
ncbi:hypothetical protein RvY_07196 [Ramazzottius varieornatus]|uniref:Cell division cycle protein 27 homolog n=1 Tax=Ramazzottius varieornatus TaxID=947166 RepID=A0A1D1V9S4_RAMVA|nr:hypothetical protein RvY_07196 [Ramazzottius varieornatus]